MADNFLERHRDEYEARKAEWLLRKKSPYKTNRSLDKPEDESL
ncbi:dehydrogenase [Prevotella sp. oral taxon 376]|nr:dehydrogenase [Prevotella sp. oral taxon 376]PTL32650.1 dehydrogenase [Prevotella sp. oral taxon 376]